MAEGGEGSTSVYGFVPGSDADYVSVPECLRVSVTVLMALGRHGCFQVALRPSTPIRLLNQQQKDPLAKQRVMARF